MTQWKVCRQTIHPMQPLYSVCCKINGVTTTDSRLYASRDEAWKRLKKLAMGQTGQTEWRIIHQIVHLSVALYQACSKADGVLRTDHNIYPTYEKAQKRMNELNAKEKAPDAAATAQGAEK